MKKLFLFLLVTLVLFTLASYLLIPKNISISSAITVKTTDLGTERFTMDENKWAFWWQSEDGNRVNRPNDKEFKQGSDSYRLAEKYYKSASIRIRHNSRELKSRLMVIPLALDSTGIEWKSSMASGTDPFSRLAGYLEAKKIKNNMDAVLQNLKNFLSNVENVYGIPIERNFLKDTLYVTSKNSLTTTPSNKEIYALIKKITAYAVSKGANVTGSPIFNVTTMADNRYQLMTGVPVDKNIAETNAFSLKHMVRGSFIITEVLGGDESVKKASKSLQQYFSDYRKTSMAMNFNMLVTDRMYQPDSSKWITKLYQPVY